MRAFCPALPPARRPTGSWSPRLLGSNVLQDFPALSYSAQPLAGVPVIQPDAGIGVGVPRGQRCVLFDGVDDFATTAAFSVGTVHTFAVWAKSSLSGLVFSGSDNLSYALYHDGTSLYYGISGAFVSVPHTIQSAVRCHYAVVRNGTAVSFFVNGSQVGTTQTLSSNGAWSFRDFGSRNGASLFIGGKFDDVRVYSVAKSASEVQAIYNQHLTPTTLDRTGLLAAWWLNEESGTTHYDWSGNGRHLTATNVTQSTYHATDSGVKYNAANELGYTLSGNVVIPRNEADISKDASGGALQFAGPIQLVGTVEVPCVTGDGSSMFIDMQQQFIPLSGDWELNADVWFPASPAGFSNIFAQSDAGATWASDFRVYYSSQWRASFGNWSANVVSFTPVDDAWNRLRIRKVGTTLFASVNGGAESSATCAASITGNQPFSILGSQSTFVTKFQSTGRVANVSIASGGVTRFIPLQDGPGSSNTNRDIAWVASDGTGGVVSNAIVNGTVASIWANRTNVVRDWCIEYGGSIAANGAFVPGRIGSSLDAAGNAKGIAAGTHGNPYSRFVPNNWSAPSLVNIGSTASDAYAPSGMAGVQAESTANTRYASQARYLAVANALTGSDKTNAEGWVA